jgi:predicted DNA-binding WGR domain protein
MKRLRRVDPAQRMARSYLITTQPDLLGGCAVLREWGRIGRAGQVRVDLHPDDEAAEMAAAVLAARKQKRGYR